MMGFTADGQLKPELVRSRDRELGISTAAVKKARADLARTAPRPDPGADGWQDGTSPQLVLNEMPLRNRR
ncbi:hypothetical protein [Gluconacetobacter azotocaptans]|nr:hypothetical protein [Gluconacetobacter azotocaptans]